MRGIAARARDGWARRPRLRSDPAPEMGWKQRAEALETRLGHVESELEGLQDAVHRQAVREHASIEDLRQRLEPDRIARELSDDARRRGI